MSSTDRTRTLANWALASVCLFWGTTYAAIAIAVRTMPPFCMSCIRFFIAGSVLLAYALYRGIPVPSRKDIIRHAIVGTALLGIANGMIVWAQRFIPSSFMAVLLTSTPFFFVGTSSLLGRKATRGEWIGMAIGFVGVTFLLWPKITAQFDSATHTETTTMVGSLIAVGACMSWAGGSVYAQQRPSEANKLMGLAIEILAAGAFTGLLSVVFNQWPDFHPSAEAWWALVWLIVFGSWVGYGCYLYCLAHLPPARISLYSYCNPVVAVFLGWALPMLHETIDAHTIQGAAIVLAGVVVINRSRASNPPQAPQPARPVSEVEVA